MRTSARTLVVAVVLALVAAPSVIDACVFSCQAAASFATRIGAQPCHHHQGHHPTVGDQHTARVHDQDSAAGVPDAATQAITLAVSVELSGDRLTTIGAPAPGPPAVGSLTPLRI